MNLQEEVNNQIRKLKQVKPPMRVLVHDLPKEEETEANTIYTIQQEWVMMDGKWVRLS